MILDTNAISALASGHSEVAQLISQARSPSISFISIAEFKFGLLGSTRPEAGETLLKSLTEILPTLCPDSDTLTHYAQIAHQLKLAGRPIPQNDIWTAALARQLDQPVLSRDRHFDSVKGLKRIAWTP